jgi:protocatechuate 3,4-dioxygenase beta subunit
MRLLVALLLAPLALTGQADGVSIPNQPPAAPAPQYRPEDLCSVEGQVVNSETGGPVNKASLALFPMANGAGRAALSDASGRFAFQNVSPGTYRMMFSRSGYRTAGTVNDFPIISLERGQKQTGILLRATPLGIVAGRVLDGDGDPVAHAPVQLSRFQYVQGRKQLTRADSATTNDLGEYRFFDVDPGKYLVSATASRMLQISTRTGDSTTTNRAMFVVDPGGDEDYAVTFYPGTRDPATAARIDIAPGAQIQNINIGVLKTRTVSVRGRIGNPALGERLSVTLAPRNSQAPGALTRGATVDRLGNFELTNVLPGSYVLTATISQPGKPAYQAREFLEVGTSNVDGVGFPISPPTEVRGRIRVEGQYALVFSNLRVSLALRDGDTSFGATNGKVNDDGSFLLESVSLERYDVVLAGLPNGCYVKAIRAGDADVLAAGLDRTGGVGGQIEIVVNPHAGQISGAIRNPRTDQPAGGAAVALIPQEKGRRERDTFYQTATADQAGRFILRGISPGEYKVFAWEQIEAGGAYMDPEFVKPVEDKGLPVTIREGDKPEIQLNAIPR